MFSGYMNDAWIHSMISAHILLDEKRIYYARRDRGRNPCDQAGRSLGPVFDPWTYHEAWKILLVDWRNSNENVDPSEPSTSVVGYHK